jgi:cytochrome c553
MKTLRLIIAILTIVFFAGPSLAGDVEPASIENCVWCHGTSGQGYTPAPRLAGQRRQYIENQLLDFRTHTRDNPVSRQYMWSAVANLSPQTGRDLATYFSTLPPKAANDTGRSQPQGVGYIKRDYRIPILLPALLVMAPMLRASEKLPVWEDWHTPT